MQDVLTAFRFYDFLLSLKVFKIILYVMMIYVICCIFYTMWIRY